MKEITSVVNLELTIIHKMNESDELPDKEEIARVLKDFLGLAADKVDVKKVKHFEMDIKE